MAAPLQLGLYLPSAEAAPGGQQAHSFDRLLEIARQAEDAGFHSVWWPDHYFIQAGPGQRRGSFEAWTLMSALAARTSRIKIGSLVLCNTFRHVAILAKQATSLQEISGGRLILGLGAGWHEPEYQALGLPFDHRVGRLKESVTVIRELFDTGTSSYKGRWLKLDDAQLMPRPQTKVPLWIAASGPNILQVTAKFADGWNLAWFGSDPGRFIKKAGELKTACVEAGRPENAIELSVGIQGLVTAPGGEAAAIAAVKQSTPGMASLEDAQVKRRLLIGDARSFTADLQGFADAGASLAIIGFPGLAPMPDRGSLERLLRLAS
jgi:FMNH2-dependent dimethyl sulfone monooxygenase